MSYLGKISAIVSANTADFTAKLNGSAKEVRKFASSVESTIGAASRQAAASLSNIYTPLQKLERALQAASTMKLSFSGFAGAIKDIDVLKQRMTSLNQRQIDIILKTSGLKSINEFKDAVQGLNSKQFDVLLRVGGAEKLKKLREEIASGEGEFEVVAKTREAEERVKELTQQVNEAKKSGSVVITVNDEAVAAARSELRTFTIERSKALGQQRVKPREFRADLIGGIASEQAALARSEGRQAERDRLLGAATTDRQRTNINKNYAGVDSDIEKRAASIEKLKASLAELERLEEKLKAARAGTASDSDLKKYEAELDATTKKHRELVAESQKKITAAIGVNVNEADLEKLLSGAIERGEILERVFREAGLEGTAAFERVVAVLKDLGISDMEAAIAKMRQMASVTEAVTKPLAKAVKDISLLSVDVQASLHPALTAAQAGAQSLSDELERAGTVGEAGFQAMTGEIDRFAAAAGRAKEAAAAVSSLPTGRELRFQRPELVAGMDRTAAVQKQMSELPTAGMGGMDVFVAQQRAAAEEVEKRSAALDNAMLMRSKNAPGDVAAARAAYEDAIASQERLNSTIEREVAARMEAANAAGRAAADAKKAADEETAILIRRYQREKELESERVAAAQKAADNEIAALTRREMAAKDAETRRAAAAQKAADEETAILIRRQQREKELQDARQAPAKAVDEMLGGKMRRGYDAQSDVLGSVVSRLSGDALEQGRAALIRFEEAKARALKSPGDAGLRKELERIGNEAVRTIAKLEGSGVSVAGLARQFSRSGDVGRMGVDKFSLALNQAAFAVDDFMSSTGGMEFKLRAISNNITQLAFVLGGTTGLWIGLGTVIGGQVALQILKFVNGGRTAEDQTKALNDALARQKSLVEELAQAFRSLGDAMARDAFSDAGGRRRDVDKSLEDIRKKQQERRRESIASVDPEVLKERATQASLNRQISQQTDVGQILNLQRKLRESQERERAAADAAVGRKPPGAADVGNELRQSFARMTDAATMDAVDEASAAAARAAGERRQAEFVAPRDLSEARAAIIARQKELGAAAESGMLTPNSRAGATEEIRRLQAVLESLDAPLKKSLDEAANKIVEDSRGPAEQIRQAQEEVAKAIEAGVPGAREFQRQLDRNATRLAEAYKKLEQAAAGVDENGRPLNADQSQKKVEEAQADIARLEARRSGLAAQADALSYQRIVDPQRQLSAIMDRSRGNLRDAGLGDGAAARRLREIDSEMEAIRRRASLPDLTSAQREAIKESERALKEEAAAIEATTIALKLFGDALDKASGEAKGNLSAAQQRADETRRNDLAMGTPQSLRERQRAEADLATQRRLEADAQREIANQRDREAEVRRGPQFARMREIDETLSGGGVSAGQAATLRRERAMLEAQVQPQLDAARQRAQAAVEASTRQEELQKRALRGEELIKRPDQKFAEETARGLGAIQERFRQNSPNDAAGLAAEQQRYMRQRAEDARTQTSVGRGAEAALTDIEKFRRDVRRPGGLAENIGDRYRQLEAAGVNPLQRVDFLRSALNQQMEEVAPMLKGFDDERRNAMLQGPSRAALGVSDITTSQGMSELNRLLRGDDPAKDVNLAELRKQTEKFDELIRAVRDNVLGVVP